MGKDPKVIEKPKPEETDSCQYGESKVDFISICRRALE